MDMYGDELAIDDLINCLIDDLGDVIAGFLEVGFGDVGISLSHGYVAVPQQLADVV